MYDDVNGEGKMLIKRGVLAKGRFNSLSYDFLYNFSVKKNIDELSSTYSLKLLTRNCFIILICALFSSHTQTQKNISSHNSRQKEIRFHQSLSFSHFFFIAAFSFCLLIFNFIALYTHALI